MADKNRNSISGVGIEFVNVSAEKKEKLSNLINYIDRVLNDNKDAVNLNKWKDTSYEQGEYIVSTGSTSGIGYEYLKF